MATSLVLTGVSFPDSSVRTTALHVRYRNKAIFGYGIVVAVTSTTNLVSDTGVVSADVTGVGTALLQGLAAAGYGS